MHAHSDARFYVAMIHGANTSPKNTSHRLWRAHEPAEVEALFGIDAPFYATSFGRQAAPKTRISRG